MAKKKAAKKKAAKKKAAKKKTPAKRKKAPSTFERLQADIDRVGWHVVMVPEDDEGPGFAYTIGAFSSFQAPELIIVGLPLEVMHGVLNGAVEAMKGGTRFALDTPVPDLLEGYDCVFRAVDRSHYDEHVGVALRHHGGPDFPLLQCIWPDMQGKFPWDDGVNPGLIGAQPLLDTPWPFRGEARNVAVLTDRFVLDGAPILEVTHDEDDGMWQFLCGKDDLQETDARLVSLQSIVLRDPSVGALADLPLGWAARRDAVAGIWTREAAPAEG